MGFIIDGLDAEAYDRYSMARSLRLLVRILRYFRPACESMRAGRWCSSCSTRWPIPCLPLLLARGIDSVERAAHVERRLGWLVAPILVARCLSWTFNFVRQRYTARPSARCGAKAAPGCLRAVWRATCRSMTSTHRARSSAASPRTPRTSRRSSRWC